MSFVCRLSIVLWLLFHGFPAFPLVLTLGTQAGVLLQPSSQYFHGVYGAYLKLATADEAVLLQTSYLERPVFTASGYADQERGAFGLLGTKVAGSSLLNLSAYLGYGEMQGYIRHLQSQTTRRFTTGGLSTLVELNFSLAFFHLGLSHQSLVAFVSNDQTMALVAWPFSTFLLALGVSL